MRPFLVAILSVLVPTLGHAFTFGTSCADANGQEILVRGCPVTCTIFVGPNDADEPVSIQDVHYVVHHADGDAVVEGSGTPITLQPGDSQVAFPIEITANASDIGDRLTMTAVGELEIHYPDSIQPIEDTFAGAVTIVDQGACPVMSTTTTTTLDPFCQRHPHTGRCRHR